MMEQIFAVIFGLILGVGGPLIIWSGLRQYRLQSRFEANGQTTDALVTGLVYLQRGAKLMNYDYVVEVDGAQKAFSARNRSLPSHKIRQGDAIQIEYLADAPHISQAKMPTINYRASAIISIVVGIGIIGAFIYLLPFILGEFQ